jgi:flagellar motor switch protein FliN
VAKNIEFDDPLEDIDPIMEQAFSVNEDVASDSVDLSNAGDPIISDEPEYDFYADDTSDDNADTDFYEDTAYDAGVEEVDGLAPTVSDIQFPSLEEKPSGQPFEASVFNSIPVGVSVELGRSRVSLKEVFELSEGSIIELERMVGEPLDLVVNGQIVANGEVVAIDNNYGLRVTNIVSPS